MLLKIGAILLGLSVLFGLLTRQFRNGRERKARLRTFSLGLTGAQFARQLIEAKDIVGVEVVESNALITNHYDPVRRELRLSSDNYHGRDLAAVGHAAHEVGHAIQGQSQFKPLLWRQSAIKFNAYASIAIFLFSLPFFVAMPRLALLFLGVGWALVRVFDIFTLGVEFDASGRVKDLIYNGRFLRLGPEFDQLQEVLEAAVFDKMGGFSRFWEWLFSVVFPWRKPKAPPA